MTSRCMWARLPTMSYTCPLLTDQLNELVNKARESFPQATRSRGAGQDEKWRVTRTYNRQIRIAMVQGLCDGIDKSDAEDKQDGDPGNQSGKEQEKPGSGNVKWGADSCRTPLCGLVHARNLLRTAYPRCLQDRPDMLLEGVVSLAPVRLRGPCSLCVNGASWTRWPCVCRRTILCIRPHARWTPGRDQVSSGRMSSPLARSSRLGGPRSRPTCVTRPDNS